MECLGRRKRGHCNIEGNDARIYAYKTVDREPERAEARESVHCSVVAIVCDIRKPDRHAALMG